MVTQRLALARVLGSVSPPRWRQVAQSSLYVAYSILAIRRRFLATSMLLLAATGQLCAQSVSGTVTDEDGRPLAGANVLLLNDTLHQYRYGTTSAADGSFEIAAVAQGEYQVTVTFLGYDSYLSRVVVSDRSDVSFEVTLATGTIAHPEVVVAARRARPRSTPVTFSNLTAEDLRARPDMKDLPSTLSSRPSTTYYSENGNGIGYSTLRIRGFDQRRIAVSINGIPQNDPEDFNVFWVNFFDIDGAVDDIQVQRGAGASLYGSTGIGGAINIVAMPYRPVPYAELSVAYGSYDTRRVSIEANSGLLGDRYVAFGRFSRLKSDGYRDWSWSEFDRFFAGVTRYGDRSTLTLQAYGGPQRDGLAFSGIPRSANSVVDAEAAGVAFDRRFNVSLFSRDTEDFHQPHVELHHEWTPTANVGLSQTAFWVKGEGYFDFGATFRSADYLMLPDGFVAEGARSLPLFLSSPSTDVLFRAYLDQWQVGWIPRINVASRFGRTQIAAEARLHRSVRWGRIEEAVGIPVELVGADADRRVYQFRGEKVITSASLSHSLRPSQRSMLQAEALVSYSRYRSFGDDFFGVEFSKPYLFVNPRLGLTINPERVWSAYASLGYSSREPRLKSLYDGEEAGAGFVPRFATDPDGRFDTDQPLVEAEHLLDAELGFTRSDERSLLSVNGYWMEFVDEIVPSGGLDQFGVPRTGNADRTRHVGLEAEWRIRLARRLQVYGNFSLARARYRDFVEFLPDGSPLDRAGNPIPGFPATSGNLELTYRSGGLRLSAFARYVGRQYIDNSGGRGSDGFEDPSLTVDPYVLVDASVSQTFRRGSMLEGLSLSLDVNNVANSKVLLFGNVGPVGPQFFPTATRHVLLRATYTLR